MAAASVKPDKNTVIETLLMVFEHSAAKDLMASGALRSLLSVEFEDLLDEHNVFDLELVWEILEEQPGFDAEAVTAPLCLFRTFEPHLNMTIKLPEAMAALSSAQVSVKASDVKIPAVEMKRVLRGADLSDKKAPAPAPSVIEIVDETDNNAGPNASRRALPSWVMAVAMVIALGAFAFAGSTLYRSCAAPRANWKSQTIEALADLPVKDARRFGNQVTATLTDEAWLAKDDTTKKAELTAALDKMRVDGVLVLALRDSHGNIRATAQYSSRGNSLGFSFLGPRSR